MKRMVKDNVNVRRRQRPIFEPSYESKEEKENFNFLMSNEYMKIWFKERDLFLKEHKTALEKARSEPPIKRRFVQRVGHVKRERLMPVVQLKKFSGKSDTKSKQKPKTEQIEAGQRYIPQCSKMP